MPGVCSRQKSSRSVSRKRQKSSPWDVSQPHSDTSWHVRWPASCSRCKQSIAFELTRLPRQDAKSRTKTKKVVIYEGEKFWFWNFGYLPFICRLRGECDPFSWRGEVVCNSAASRLILEAYPLTVRPLYLVSILTVVTETRTRLS